jgi:hypothetical protein
MTMGLVHAARQIEAQGRGPDTSLAHISPDESAMLDYMQGGRRMNPVTGLPEYSLFGKILKAVAKIGASTVGFMYGGPLGAAAASAAVSKLTGDSWKSALTTGAISGITSGIGNVASGGFKNALSSGLNQGSGLGGLGFSKTAATLAKERLAETAAGNLATTTPGSFVPSGLPTSVTNAAGETVNLPAGLANRFIPATITPAVNSITSNLSPILGSSLASSIGNAGYGVLGAGLGAGISTKGTPATPQSPAWNQTPFDSSNVSSFLRPSYRAMNPTITNNPAPTPMDVYNQSMDGLNQQMYADGGDVAPVGMGLPQSAAMPQLMSAAQFGYLNARTGGMIAGPGDGKSDDIPALLSNGEHVIDAATVSDLGNGDNDTGQKRLEVIKHKIRSSAGRKNPRKASPKQKGLGSLLNSARA